MHTLVIDTATENCSVALFDNGAPACGECRSLGRGHAEYLIPMISRLPGRGKAQLIAVSLGPGSFTGVRIGIAAARALALAWGAEVVGYPTLGLVAAMARAEIGPQPVSVVMTGGHGEWFLQDYAADGSAAGTLASLKPEDAATRAKASVAAGSQAEALVTLRGHGQALSILPDARQFPLLKKTALVANAAPLYGRPPDARLPEQAR